MSFIRTAKLAQFTTATPASPVMQRRSKMLVKIDEQLKLASDSSCQPMKTTWHVDADGVKHRVERAKRVKRWWNVQSDGSVLLTVRYGIKALELAKGKNAVLIGSEAELVDTLHALRQAVADGEFDDLIDKQAQFGRRVRKTAS